MAPVRILWRSSLGADLVTPEMLPGGCELRVETDPATALELRDWPEILVDGTPHPEQLGGERLRRVVIPYAGVREGVRAAVAERPRLTLHNSHFNAPFVAQHALALLLAAANRLVPGDGPLRRGDWRDRYDETLTSLDLRGKRALLLGFGAIGRLLAPQLRALGMEPSAFRSRVPAEPELPTYGPDALLEALSGAHAAIVSLPATPATRGLLGDAELAALAPGALVVNVGRGDVIDEWALWRALSSGHLGGAGLDVWWRYPDDEPARGRTFPSEAPLHLIPNLVMSPHRANQVHDWQLASVRDVAATIAAALRGEERSVVDVGRGY